MCVLQWLDCVYVTYGSESVKRVLSLTKAVRVYSLVTRDELLLIRILSRSSRTSDSDTWGRRAGLIHEYSQNCNIKPSQGTSKMWSNSQVVCLERFSYIINDISTRENGLVSEWSPGFTVLANALFIPMALLNMRFRIHPNHTYTLHRIHTPQ